MQAHDRAFRRRTPPCSRCAERTTPRPWGRATSSSTADIEALMVDWLNELLYLHETVGALFTDAA